MSGSAARAAILCWLAGFTVLAVSWWDSGEQASAATQMPALVVALGIGLGSITLGGALWVLDRSRARERARARLLAAVVARAEGRR